MNIGIIESYFFGFLDVVPEGEDSDYWQIAAVHINGQAYCPTPRLYRERKSGTSTLPHKFMIGWLTMKEKLVMGLATVKN